MESLLQPNRPKLVFTEINCILDLYFQPFNSGQSLDREVFNYQAVRDD